MTEHRRLINFNLDCSIEVSKLFLFLQYTVECQIIDILLSYLMSVAKQLHVFMVVFYYRKMIVTLPHGSLTFFRLSAVDVHVAICDLYYKTFYGQSNVYSDK
jgi:hypothetical protein